MCDHDESAVLALYEQLVVAALVKADIPGDHCLIDQEAIELNSHGQCERQARHHPVRVVQHRLAEVHTEFSKILDERHQRLVVDRVDAADELEVVQPREVGVKGTGESQGPGDAHLPMNATGRGALGTAQQPNQGRFAGAVAADDSQVLTPPQLEADILEYAPATLTGFVVLGDLIDDKHLQFDP